VASFFRREVRTVQLWEKREGLPVRRQHHRKLGSIYAYKQELEAWWLARSAVPTCPSNCSTAPASSQPELVHQIQNVPEQCRILTIPFEPIHSPHERGTSRDIVERFADGLKNDLIIELMRIQLKPIVLPDSIPQHAQNSKTELMKRMAREVGARLLLTGSIRYAGNHVRVSAQLIRASDLLCMWSDRFDSNLDNLLTTQSELAQRMVRALPDLQRTQERCREQSLEANQNVAHHACAMGFHYWQMRGRSALSKALTYFQDAIELEPRCADAFAGLADTYVSLSYNHLIPAIKAAERAREAVEKALKLDCNSVKVRNSLINLLIHCTWDLWSAERECRDLLEHDKHDARTLQLYSSLMNLCGRHRDAIDLALQAYRLEPLSDLVNGQLSLAYFYAGDYGRALCYIRRTIDLQPEYLMAYALLGRTESELGNWSAAIKAFQHGLEISQHCPFIKALLAYAYAGSGDATTARTILRALEEQSHDECFPAYDVSAVHAILNQDNEALREIHKAYGTRDMKTIFIQHDPRFARLRGSAGFQQIASALQTDGQVPKRM
jgi:serine/threonine-protein kinase